MTQTCLLHSYLNSGRMRLAEYHAAYWPSLRGLRLQSDAMSSINIQNTVRSGPIAFKSDIQLLPTYGSQVVLAILPTVARSRERRSCSWLASPANPFAHIADNADQISFRSANARRCSAIFWRVYSRASDSATVSRSSMTREMHMERLPRGFRIVLTQGGEDLAMLVDEIRAGAPLAQRGRGAH